MNESSKGAKDLPPYFVLFYRNSYRYARNELAKREKEHLPLPLFHILREKRITFTKGKKNEFQRKSNEI